MSNSSPWILVFPLSILAFQSAWGANPPGCLKDFDKTYEDARAVARAYNCESSRNLSDCMAHMGLGQRATELTALLLGAKAVKHIRDKHFGVCAIAQRNPWIESAVAASSCTSIDRFEQMKLEQLNNRLLHDYEALLEKQKEEIAKAERILKGEAVNLETMKADAAAAKEKARLEFNKAALDKGVDMSKLEGYQRELQIKGTAVVQEFEKLTKKPLTSMDQIDQLRSYEHRARLGVSQEAAERVLALDSEARELMNKLDRAKTLTTRFPNDEALQRASRAMKLADAELERIAKTPAPPQLNQYEAQALQSRIKEMKIQVARLENNRAVSLNLKKILSPASVITAEDVQDSEQVLRELTKGTPRYSIHLEGPKLNFKNSVRNTRVARFFENEKFFKDFFRSLTTGQFKKAALTVVTAAGATAGFAAPVLPSGSEGALSFTDPISMALHSGSLHCEDGQSHESQLFPFQSGKCVPDFTVNSRNVEFLNLDKDSLKIAIKENPEICEFIHWNKQTFYPSAKADCQSQPASIQFSNGARVAFTSNTMSFYGGPQTKDPVEIKYDVYGNETMIRSPRRAQGGKKGGVSYAQLDLAKYSASAAADQLGGVYTGYLPVIAESMSCCNPDGVRPSDEDCSRYGILPQNRSTNGSQGTGVQ